MEKLFGVCRAERVIDGEYWSTYRVCDTGFVQDISNLGLSDFFVFIGFCASALIILFVYASVSTRRHNKRVEARLAEGADDPEGYEHYVPSEGTVVEAIIGSEDEEVCTQMNCPCAMHHRAEVYQDGRWTYVPCLNRDCPCELHSDEVFDPDKGWEWELPD